MSARPLWMSCLLVASLAAQDAERESLVPEPLPRKQLTAAELQAQVDALKQSLLPRLMGERTAERPEARDKWLAAWRAIQSPHYLVFTNGPVTCKKYADTLERLYAYVKKELPFDDPDHLLNCFIFADPEEYYRFSVQVAGWTDEAARKTAGHATGAYYATYYESPTAKTVFHEATHQIVHACLKVPGVGSWFQEGLAVYFEEKTAGEKPAGVIKNDLKRGDHYPLAEFFAIPTLLSDPKGNGHRNYAHAGALLDFLINTKVAPVAGRFPEFLAAARKGRGFGRGAEVSIELVKTVYGLTPAELEQAWKQHVGVAK